MALAYVMTTYNTTMYQTVHKKLQEAVSRYVNVVKSGAKYTGGEINLFRSEKGNHTQL